MAEKNLDTSRPEAEAEARPEQRSEFGFAGGKQKQDLENRIVELQSALTERETDDDLSPEQQAEREQLDYELKEKQLELDIFLQEHDNGGAFKMKRFNENFSGLFEDGKLRTGEDGRLELDESEAEHRMAVINIGELARFNTEGGGHKAGDEILKESVRVIEDKVMKHLENIGRADQPYSIYRFDNSEYMIDIPNISQDEMQQLIQGIVLEQPSIDGVEDPAPLTAMHTSLAEMVSVYNESFDRLVEESGGLENVPRPDGAGLQREVYGVMRNIADYQLDVEKFVSRTARIQEKIDELGVDGARSFFDNYMKKMFAETPLKNLEDFTALSDREVYDLAFEWASRELGLEQEQDSMLDELAESYVASAQERRRPVETPEQFVYSSGEEVKLAEVPEQTAGLRILAEAQRAEDEAEARYQQDKDNPKAQHERNMARLENRQVKARRDSGTGLLERGVYYGDLEQDLAEGKETAIVFVDMGFLKYFDKAGGREVGNNALKMAADLMERAVEETGLEATVYRYGGDEFTVKINGGPDDVAEFNAKLFELTKEAGAIPAGRAGNERGYYPTPLEFNYGAIDSKQLEEALDMLEERGALKLGEREDLNKQAEIMTQIADKMIETQKAVQRFELLIRQLEDDRYWTEEGDEDFKQHADKLIEFSAKGIFGERGGQQKLMAWSERRRSGEDPSAIRQEIMAWVGEQIAGTREQSQEKQDLREQLIEQLVKDAYRAQLDQAEAAVKVAAESVEQDSAATEDVRREIEGI